MRDSLEEEVLERIRPTPEEREYIREMAEKIIHAVEEIGGIPAMVVGSSARNTFVSGDRDLDIFMFFPPEMSREELEERGLSVGRAVAESFGARWREKYAEHPYLNFVIDSLEVDLVPCYAVSRADQIRSAVDRTPFHAKYVVEHIDGLVDDVLLFKQFAKAGGIYGSDHATGGLSGYLCELLVLHYGGFRPLLEAAAMWRPGEFIDIEGHCSREFAGPLVVVDPVDPGRNVASSLSLDRMCELIELARGYLEEPSFSFFFPPPPLRLSRAGFSRILRERGTSLYSMVLRTPPFTADTVVPQLRKTGASIAALLERSGFQVLHWDCAMSEEKSIIIFELLTSEIAAICEHTGPPVWNRVNARRFVRKHLADPESIGPFIVNGRYVVERPRKFRNARDLLISRTVLKVGHGKHIREALEEGWTVCEGDDCWDPLFTEFLSAFIRRGSPLTRIRRGGGSG
ncbi:MAG: CCA tRNA nucleotidyltransferase [Methanoculleaceae archaeon]